LTNDAVHVAMMNLLWPREGLDRSMFFDYWSGAHTQISSRLPGIHQYFQQHLDADAGQLFPGAKEFSDVTAHPGFFGDAEITFANERDLGEFAAALEPLMQDEQNVFAKTISYQATRENTATIKDTTLDDSPNGDLGSNEKYLLYVRRRLSEGESSFREAMRTVADRLASSDDVDKVRYRFVEHYDNDAVTLLAPNVSNFEPDSQQIQASIEVVFHDALSRRRYGQSTLCDEVTSILRERSVAVYPMRALRTFTVYNHGQITLAGLRTPQMAAQIAAIGALNQTYGSTRALMLAEHTQAASLKAL